MQHTFSFNRDDFERFFLLMQECGTVQAPVRVSEKSFAFRPVGAAAEIAMEALRTILPPKKFFQPPRETLLKWHEGEIQQLEPVVSPLVLFGVHPCDLSGLTIFEKVYMNEPGSPHYQAHRQAALVVGLSCMPDEHCFCSSTRSDSPVSGYDVFLTDLDGRYFVQVNTPAGLSFVEKGRDFIREADAEDQGRYREFWRRRSKSFRIGFSDNNLTTIMDMGWHDELWEELAQRCLSCGNCTPVCPTCYCFDLVDIASLNGVSGERERVWDSCQLSGFAAVAGDFNFRATPVERLKFWYRHKLHGFEDGYGLKTCVGCGRCTVSCPAGIDDIVGVVLRLRGERVELELTEERE